MHSSKKNLSETIVNNGLPCYIMRVTVRRGEIARWGLEQDEQATLLQEDALLEEGK
jgi:hypothetical protein